MDQTRKDGTIVGLLLVVSATTGLVDAASVLGLGKVFTANMTGNIVFLGFALAGAPGFQWPLYVAALLLFALGAVAGGRLHEAHALRGRRPWLIWAGTIEGVLLGLAAGCAWAGGGRPSETAVLSMIGLTATAMGMRNATVRQLKVADLTTTVLTLTITGIFTDSQFAGGSGNQNLQRRAAAVLSILVGAFVGGLLVLQAGLAPPLALAAIVTLVATVTLAHDLPAET